MGKYDFDISSFTEDDKVKDRGLNNLVLGAETISKAGSMMLEALGQDKLDIYGAIVTELADICNTLSFYSAAYAAKFERDKVQGALGLVMLVLNGETGEVESVTDLGDLDDNPPF